MSRFGIIPAKNDKVGRGGYRGSDDSLLNRVAEGAGFFHSQLRSEFIETENGGGLNGTFGDTNTAGFGQYTGAEYSMLERQIRKTVAISAAASTLGAVAYNVANATGLV